MPVTVARRKRTPVVAGREVAQRVGHVAGVQAAGRHLVEQRLERVVRVPVDQRHPEPLLGQLGRRRHPAKPAPTTTTCGISVTGPFNQCRGLLASGPRRRPRDAGHRSVGPHPAAVVASTEARDGGADSTRSCSPSGEPDHGDVAAQPDRPGAICSTSSTVSTPRRSSCHLRREVGARRRRAPAPAPRCPARRRPSGARAGPPAASRPGPAGRDWLAGRVVVPLPAQRSACSVRA